MQKKKKGLKHASWENINNKTNYSHFALLYYLQASGIMHLSAESGAGANKAWKREARQNEECLEKQNCNCQLQERRN